MIKDVSGGYFIQKGGGFLRSWLGGTSTANLGTGMRNLVFAAKQLSSAHPAESA